ncbi:LamG domain-containing protein [Cesiribacter sp. SM1]|uniref:LamG domain-containing protein n=1 Tax=Cesiribacter sp. SM1 TaxID=2861196 RepID=UPI001CD2FB99|nr:LamG domain-containing protein [Cesiribacter sp. SM1]
MLPAVFKSISMSIVCILMLMGCAGTKTEEWQLNQLEGISGYSTTVLGNPAIIETEEGKKAMAFDGVDDGLLLHTNPIAGADEFTIEIVFKPYPGYPANREQRFLHIQDPQNDQRRILMELRLNDRGEWYPDLFMRTENEALTLIDSTKTHPVNAWAQLRLTYQDGQLKGYVNGKEELSGQIRYLPVSPIAKTSIGVRMNKVSWFKGAIQSVSFTSGVPEPK